MRRLIYYTLSFIGAVALFSCTEEVSELKQEGNPVLQIEINSPMFILEIFYPLQQLSAMKYRFPHSLPPSILVRRK